MGLLWLSEKRKGDLGDRFRRLAWEELSLLITPLVASFLGTLRV